VKRLCNWLVWGGAAVMFAAYPIILWAMASGLATAFLWSFGTMYVGAVAIYCGLKFEPRAAKSV